MFAFGFFGSFAELVFESFNLSVNITSERVIYFSKLDRKSSRGLVGRYGFIAVFAYEHFPRPKSEPSGGRFPEALFE